MANCSLLHMYHFISWFRVIEIHEFLTAKPSATPLFFSALWPFRLLRICYISYNTIDLPLHFLQHIKRKYPVTWDSTLRHQVIEAIAPPCFSGRKPMMICSKHTPMYMAYFMKVFSTTLGSWCSGFEPKNVEPISVYGHHHPCCSV